MLVDLAGSMFLRNRPKYDESPIQCHKDISAVHYKVNEKK